MMDWHMENEEVIFQANPGHGNMPRWCPCHYVTWRRFINSLSDYSSFIYLVPTYLSLFSRPSLYASVYQPASLSKNLQKKPLRNKKRYFYWPIAPTPDWDNTCTVYSCASFSICLESAGPVAEKKTWHPNVTWQWNLQRWTEKKNIILRLNRRREGIEIYHYA